MSDCTLESSVKVDGPFLPLLTTVFTVRAACLPRVHRSFSLHFLVNSRGVFALSRWVYPRGARYPRQEDSKGVFLRPHSAHCAYLGLSNLIG
jgi:hypothetical protein